MFVSGGGREGLLLLKSTSDGGEEVLNIQLNGFEGSWQNVFNICTYLIVLFKIFKYFRNLTYFPGWEIVGYIRKNIHQRVFVDLTFLAVFCDFHYLGWYEFSDFSPFWH